MTAPSLTVERDTFARHIMAALGDRVRITKDAEGWPLAPGRYGRLEWRGAEWATGEARLYAYTGRRLIRSRLLALPGVHRHQVGDGEAVVSLAAGDTAAIRAVAALLRLRQRRQLTPAQRQAAAERLAKPRATFRPKTA